MNEQEELPFIKMLDESISFLSKIKPMPTEGKTIHVKRHDGWELTNIDDLSLSDCNDDLNIILTIYDDEGAHATIFIAEHRIMALAHVHRNGDMTQPVAIIPGSMLSELVGVMQDIDNTKLPDPNDALLGLPEKGLAHILKTTPDALGLTEKTEEAVSPQYKGQPIDI